MTIQMSQPTGNCLYQIVYPFFVSGSTNPQYGAIKNIDTGAQNVGAFDTLADAEAACQTDFDNNPPS